MSLPPGEQAACETALASLLAGLDGEGREIAVHVGTTMWEASIAHGATVEGAEVRAEMGGDPVSQGRG